MPNLTVDNVLTSVRSKLGDNTAVAAGRVVSNTELLDFMQSALLEFNQITRHLNTAYFARREMFVHVVPNVGFIPIDAFGILTDISLIEEAWERKVETYVSVTNVAAATTAELITFTTGAAHNLSLGNQFQIVGSVFNWANGLYTATIVPGATSVITTGRPLTAGGAETNTGARLLYSIGAWNRVGISGRHLTSDLPIENIPLITLEDGGIRINPVNGDRVLKVMALVGIDTVPLTTDILGYPESQEFLALKTALVAHMSKGGNPDRIRAIREELYGQGGDPANIVGGAAKLLVRGIVLQGQNVRYIRPRFRPPRQVSTPAYIKF